MNEEGTIYLTAKERATYQREANLIRSQRMDQVRKLRMKAIEKPKVLEKDVLKQVLQYLRLQRCLVYRMNTGAGTFQNATGKQRFVRFGEKGMADVLAFTRNSVIWVEAKGSTGKQSEAQRKFAQDVEQFGHTYIVAKSVEDLYPLFGGGAK